MELHSSLCYGLALSFSILSVSFSSFLPFFLFPSPSLYLLRISLSPSVSPPHNPFATAVVEDQRASEWLLGNGWKPKSLGSSFPLPRPASTLTHCLTFISSEGKCLSLLDEQAEPKDLYRLFIGRSSTTGLFSDVLQRNMHSALQIYERLVGWMILIWIRILGGYSSRKSQEVEIFLLGMVNYYPPISSQFWLTLLCKF